MPGAMQPSEKWNELFPSSYATSQLKSLDVNLTCPIFVQSISAVRNLKTIDPESYIMFWMKRFKIFIFSSRFIFHQTNLFNNIKR